MRLRSTCLAALIVLLLSGPMFDAKGQSQQGLAERIESFLDAYHDYGYFNGSALVAEGGQVVFKGGFGHADMSWDIPNTPQTKFRIGSVTKHFTAALILQLAEEGRLDLQASISDVLPEYPAAQGDRVTIHHLLTHTSGIPSYTGFPDFLEFTRDPYEPDSMLALFSGLPLEFEPGSRWAYNNSGYYLLGVVIETVTGQPFDEVLRERILDPMNLTNTGYDHYTDIVDSMATGYVKFGPGYERAPYLDTSVPYAAGMMYSTVEDLYRWDQLLYGKGPFSNAETMDLWFGPHARINSEDEASPHYGYGWMVHELPLAEDTVRVVSHGGGIFGFTTGFWRMPDERRTVILMDNTNSSHVDAIGQGLVRLLNGDDPPMPKRPIGDALDPVIESSGVEAAVERYRELLASAPEDYDFGESQLNMLGYRYLRAGRTDVAIRIFQLNVERFPESANAYDSLGEAYMEAGDRDQAIANYQKAIELNPGFENSKRMLRRLGVEVEEPQVDLSIDQLEEYVGKYAVAPNFVLDVTREEEQMYVQATGQPRLEIFPSAVDRFYLEAVDAQLTFHRGQEGDIESVTLHQAGRDMPAPRIEE